MSIASQIQTDFNNVANQIGMPVTVYELFTTAGVGSYNKYGDFAFSGADLYISGVDTVAFLQPRASEDLDIQEWGERVEGDVIGYFKSGVSLGIGYRVSGVVGDFKINEINNYFVSGVLCYNSALLDPLNK